MVPAGVGQRDQHALPEQRRVAQQEGEVPLIEHRLLRPPVQKVSVAGICSRETPNFASPSSSHSRICAGAAVEVDPRIDDVGEARIRLALDAETARQRHQRTGQQMIAAERRVLADRGQPEDRRQDMHIGAAGLQRQRAIVARLVAGELRLRTIALRRGLVQRADVIDDPDLRLVEVVPGVGVQALARDAAERMHDHRMGEADRQRALRRRVQRERQIDLVGLQIEHRVAIGGLRHTPTARRTPWRCPSPYRCRRRSIRRWQGPSGNTAARPAVPRCAASWCGGCDRRWSRWRTAPGRG